MAMNPPSSTWLLRGGLLAIFAILGAMFVKYVAAGGDWAPIRVTGGLALTDPSLIYQFDVVSSLQHPIVGDLGQRPYIYPPTALLLAAPLALIPFHFSLVLFSAAAAALLLWAAGRWSTDRWLLIASLPVVAAAYSGQPTLLVAALILFGLARLDDHPVSAGVLLGLAAILKPQLLLLAPVALIAGRHWRGIVAASVTALIAVIVAVLLFGIDLWRSWIEALPRFQALIDGHDPLLRNALSPNAAALRMGADSIGVIVAMLVIAVPVVAFVFARRRDGPSRLVALIGGALLISPYGMNYELTTLAPVVLALPLQRLRDLVLPLVFVVSMAATVSVVGLVAVYGWMLARMANPTGLPGHQPRMETGVDISS